MLTRLPLPLARCLPLTLAAMLLGALGCDEPIDCGDGPGRCYLERKAPAPPPPRAAPAPSMPTLKDLPGNQPTLRKLPPKRAEAMPTKEPKGAYPTRMIDPSQGGRPPAAGVPMGQPTADFEPHAGVVHNARKTPAQLVRRIINVAANRNVAGLKRFCTPGLRREIDAMLAKHKDRFWKHLDKYVDAASNGFSLDEQPGDDDKTRRLKITTRAGAVLQPIIEKDGKGWLFARF